MFRHALSFRLLFLFRAGSQLFPVFAGAALRLIRPTLTRRFLESALGSSTAKSP